MIQNEKAYLEKHVKGSDSDQQMDKWSFPQKETAKKREVREEQDEPRLTLQCTFLCHRTALDASPSTTPQHDHRTRLLLVCHRNAMMRSEHLLWVHFFQKLVLQSFPWTESWHSHQQVKARQSPCRAALLPKWPARPGLGAWGPGALRSPALPFCPLAAFLLCEGGASH